MKKCLRCGHRFNVIQGLELKCPKCGATGECLAPTFYGDKDFSRPMKDKQ